MQSVPTCIPLANALPVCMSLKPFSIDVEVMANPLDSSPINPDLAVILPTISALLAVSLPSLEIPTLTSLAASPTKVPPSAVILYVFPILIPSLPKNIPDSVPV